MEKESRTIYFNMNLNSEMNNSKEIHLNAIDSSTLSESNIFYIKPSGHIKTTVNLSNFKIKHCKRLRNIIFNGKRYNGLFKPKDDTHAFYIPNIQGRFVNKNNKYTDIIDPLVSRLNDTSQIDNLSQTFARITLLKKVFIFLIFIIALLLGLFCLLIIYTFILWSIWYQHSKNVELAFTVFTYITLFGLAYLFYLLITSNNKRIRMLSFQQLARRRAQLEAEVDNWNEKVLFNQNMKAVLADTFEYIQVFYNKSHVYIIEENFKF
jgi:hypothetical protein